jgi:hypothetical protein
MSAQESTTKLLKRLSTVPDYELYAALAATIPGSVLEMQEDASSSSSSGGGSVITAPVSDLAGSLARGLHLLENWALEQGPAVLEAMVLMADGLTAALGKLHSADNAAKMKMVRMLMDAGEAGHFCPGALYVDGNSC